ncbi:MAG: FAD-dependent oxidoreductase [Elainellaceae cyanobacterium]
MAADSALDVASVGAGIAGLICSRHLNQHGFRTAIFDKSRGVGGRLATRRVDSTPIDHGVRYIEDQGSYTQQLIQQMVAAGILSPAAAVQRPNPSAPATETAQLYTAPQGMTAIAKALAADLTLHRQHRVEGLEPHAGHWRLRLVAADQPQAMRATAVVLAIPAPQILPLLQPLSDEIKAQLVPAIEAVTFDPSFTVMVGYQAPPEPYPYLGLRSPTPDLDWIGFEAQKRAMPFSGLVLQSSAEFAHRAIDRMSPNAIADELVASATTLKLIADLGVPQWHQTHRWRYAFCRRPHPQTCLTVQGPLPLACCGDWCGGGTIEHAMQSGQAAADAIKSVLRP